MNKIYRNFYRSDVLVPKIFLSQIISSRNLCFSNVKNCDFFRVVVVGGGAGGSSVSNALGRKFGQKNVAVVEPRDIHYYQPLWTLVGCGVKKFEKSARHMGRVLTNSTWIKNSAVEFQPRQNFLTLNDGKRIKYDVLVIAIGLQLRYDMIKGLPEAFEAPGLCSNYDEKFVHKTLPSMQQFTGGNAIFTFPQTPIKCPGAPQKIMYLTEEFFRRTGKRDKATVIYCTASNFMFGVKAYNRPLENICEERGIKRMYRHTVTQVKSDTKEVFFDVKNEENYIVDKLCLKYEMLHISPPCSAPEILRKHDFLTDSTGFLDLDKETLQHKRYKNIFGLGDCTNLPTSKTAASAAVQSGILQHNIVAFLNDKKLNAKYDGYASCPLVTGFNTAILPEFDYSMTPLETFPFDQSKESRLLYFLKSEVMPALYWNGLVKHRAHVLTNFIAMKNSAVEFQPHKSFITLNDGKRYDGYATCPLVNGFDTAILPEFDYSMTPLENFSIRPIKREQATVFFEI